MLRKKHILSLLCLILFIGLATPQSVAVAAGQLVKVGTDNLNIRKGPGLSYPIVAKAKKGEQYSLLSENKDWIEIQVGNGVKGWVANWLVTKVNNTPSNISSEILEKNKTAIISSDGLRIRKGPGTSFPVIGTVNKGEAYTVQSKEGSWVNLQTPFGNGWVSSDFIQIQSSSNGTSVEGKLNGRITVNSLNVRSSPSLNSSIIGKLSSGDNVKILSQTSEWTEISFSGTKAWVSSQYIQLDKATATSPAPEKQQNEAVSSGKTGKVTATSLIVRDTASLSGKAIGSVKQNQSYQIIEEANNWAKIEYKKGLFGWVASWYLDKSEPALPTKNEQKVKDSSLSIIHDGSNIRKNPNTQSEVVHRANQGDIFDIVSIHNDWYEIRLPNGESGYIAGWIVSVNGSVPIIEKPGSELHLKNKKIVIDPGHGGRDNGTTGARGTLEKSLTLQTAQSLYEKLTATGAIVILTRNNDTYIPLSSRVYTSHYHNADAFISIHYDSMLDRSVHGMTTYYYHSYQKNLAANVHSSIASKTNLKDRGYRFGDYYVLRENKRNAILLELGYLSNPTEEILVSSSQFQDTVTTGIYQGLARFFKDN
ncbi:SH3 domain-containing protein [Bacillus sp. DTU_2020_1000418_1_SI_GHA_SEK_038]|uniref:SH3 domain-containing protein n=1 Tax=Bacillus sp. DTU_2020_1000418_1_SI_GHA_SEK_038 TaxID=3077585 RepID=UPI0028ECE6AA|nr:SH3 domain-containing protein [Bacillus sp. DTU_2020_1000418_1_SI_GHA_SEK_038]WNS74419.1 SH3 domain-containing protein [Bacillus sp. DTU_2020_1000418_1_SI_GHA_SEK_038]